MTSIYEARLRQLSDGKDQAMLTAYFDRVRSMDEIFRFMQRFEVKRHMTVPESSISRS